MTRPNRPYTDEELQQMLEENDPSSWDDVPNSDQEASDFFNQNSPENYEQLSPQLKAKGVGDDLIQGGLGYPQQKGGDNYSDDEMGQILNDDPNSEAASIPGGATRPDDVSGLESYGMGVSQGYTSGFMDEAVGALHGPEKYKEKRNEFRRKDAQARDQNPWRYGAGVLTGSVGQLATPGLSKVPAVASGVASGVGGSDAEMVGNPGAIAKDAFVGGLGGAASKMMSKALPTAAGVRGRAEERAFTAATGNSQKEWDLAVKKGDVSIDPDTMASPRGRALLDTDEAGGPVIGWTSKAADIHAAAEKKRKFYGDKISGVSRSVDDSGGYVSGYQIAQPIRRYLATIPKIPDNDALIAHLKQRAEFYADKRFSFAEAQKIKDEYKWSALDPNKNQLGQKATNAMNAAVGEAMEKSAGRTTKAKGVPENMSKEASRYVEYKDKYGPYRASENASLDEAIRQRKNRAISPSDYISGAGGMAAMGPAGASLGVLNRIARSRGNSFLARSGNAVSKVMQSTPEILGKYAPILEQGLRQGRGTMLLYHQLLLSHDPKYLEIVDKISQGGDQ